LVLAHYLADFPLQGSYLATEKRHNLYALLAHGAIYGLAVSLALKLLGYSFDYQIAAFLIGSHIFIDYMKISVDRFYHARFNLWVDQALHLFILYAVYLYIGGAN
jgi:hypothetical protein